jgi:hypothetical protein
LAAKIISVLYLVGVVLGGISSFTGGQPAYYGIVSLVLGLIIFGCLVYGVFTGRPAMFYPYFVWTVGYK